VAKVSKKELILESALEHFSMYGYESTTLEAIAKVCSITKPAIYYHFKDKAALYEAVICSQFSLLADTIERKTQEGDAQTQLTSYVTSFGNFLIFNPAFSAIFAREIASGAHTLPQKCAKLLSRTLLRLMEILELGEKKGVFEKENPFMVQMMIVSTLTSYNTTKPLREKIVSVLETKDLPNPAFENVIDSLSKKIIKGLLC